MHRQGPVMLPLDDLLPPLPAAVAAISGAVWPAAAAAQQQTSTLALCARELLLLLQGLLPPASIRWVDLYELLSLTKLRCTARAQLTVREGKRDAAAAQQQSSSRKRTEQLTICLVRKSKGRSVFL
jgi:hypothetical protein